jgi:catechol 2,3-dioxygenase-like lactoylglutathione lyase family enzyme
MDRVVTFLITADADAALGFYRDALGLKFIRDDGFALVFETDGVVLRIAKVPEFSPAMHTVLGWEAADIAATIDKLSAKGVAFTRYPTMDQDERGICTFPNGDKVAWFKDPAGNVLSISRHAS